MNPEGGAPVTDPGASGLVLRVCDMTSTRSSQILITVMSLVGGIAVFFTSFGRYREDIFITVQLRLLSSIFTFLGLAALPGIFFIKPIVIQKNGVFFPSHELHALPFIIVPGSVFIEYDSIDRLERRFGIHIVTRNGKKYRIPPSVDELDQIEELIRKGMTSDGQGSLPGPTG